MKDNRMTSEQQLNLLQKMGDPALAQRLAFGVGIACVLLLGTSYYQKTFFFVFLALMIVFAAGSCRPTLRHIQQAAKAWRSGRSQEAMVTVTVREDDDTAHYSATARLMHGKGWTLALTPPMGWKPETERPLPMKLYFIGEAEWPALLVHPNGILLPRATPKPTA